MAYESIPHNGQPIWSIQWLMQKVITRDAVDDASHFANNKDS